MLKKFLYKYFTSEKNIKRIQLKISDKERRYINLYMDIAKRTAEMSHCKLLKVGSVATNPTGVMFFGWNGQPSGFDNKCECGDGLKSLETNIHAEVNTIAKIASSNESSEGMSLYITHAPCVRCARLLLQSKIKEVIYEDEFKTTAGIELLLKSKKVDVYQFKNNNKFELIM